MKNLNKLLISLVVIVVGLVGLANAEIASTTINLKMHNNTWAGMSDNTSISSITWTLSGSNISSVSDTFQIIANNGTCSVDYSVDKQIYFIQTEDINESGIDALIRLMNNAINETDDLDRCIADNMRISMDNLLCQQDRGYKENFTACEANLVSKESQLTAKNTEFVNKQKEIDNEKSDKWQKYGLGALVGVVVCYFYLRGKGETTPIRFGSNIPQAPSEMM